MNNNRKWNILFIEEEKSKLDSTTKVFDHLFNKVDKVMDTQKAMELIENNEYDIIINDITVEVVEGILFLKKIKKTKPEQSLFALVSEKDTDKLFAIADLGVNAFELAPEQFDMALEEIAKFDPYLETN